MLIGCVLLCPRVPRRDIRVRVPPLGYVYPRILNTWCNTGINLDIGVIVRRALGIISPSSSLVVTLCVVIARTVDRALLTGARIARKGAHK